jgi:P4 family phage/plasmid primase-like protien
MPAKIPFFDQGRLKERSTRMYFVSRIKGARDRHEISADEFRHMTGQARAALEAGKPNPAYTLQEHIRGGYVKAHYDWDAKYVSPPNDLEFEKKLHLRDLRNIVEKIHPDKISDIVYAQRHGPLAGGGWKISYRAFVPGTRIAIQDIPKLVRSTLALGEKETHPHLDLSIYKEKEQLLGVIYGTKDTDVEKRYLVPLDVNQDPCNFLAQYTLPDDALLTVPEGAPAGGAVGPAGKKKRGRPRKNAAETGLVTSGTSTSSSSEKVLSGKDYASALTACSDFFGLRFRLQEDFTEFHTRVSDKGLIFRLQTKGTWCFIKKQRHSSNHQYVLIDGDGASYCCHDEDCKREATGRKDLHISWSDLPKELQEVYRSAVEAQSNDGEAGEDTLLDLALLADAKKECQENIIRTWPNEDNLDIRRVAAMLKATAKNLCCSECGMLTHFEHTAEGVRLRCDCGNAWPPDGYVTFSPKKYPHLHQALTILQVNVHNNVTINNFNNNTGSETDFYTDFSKDELRTFDDPVENELFLGSLQGTDTMMSRFAVYHFRNRFHCTDTERWFRFQGHSWQEVSKSYFKEAMSKDDFLRPYRQVALHFEENVIQTEETKRKARMVRRLCKYLEEGTSRERIASDSVMKFHERRSEFERLLNSQNILVFEDGVYDFDKDTFGPGSPDIPVSMCVPQPYVPYDPESEHVGVLMSFMDDILPDPEVRDFTLKFLGVCLTQEILQYFFIWTGSGGNGKGRLLRLYEECTGPYFQAVNPTMLTRKREDCNQANESLMALVKSRLAVFQEAEATDTIQAGVVKSFTGNDTLTGRANYGRQMKFRATFKLLFVCNELPKMSENTWGIWRRVRVTNFPTSFTDEPRLSHERKIDYALDEKLKEAAPWFIGILIQYFKRYRSEGISPPARVRDVTNKYRDSLDIVKEFVEENLTRHDDQNVLLKWTDLRDAFNRKNSRNPPGKRWEAFTAHGLKYQDTTVQGENFRGFKGWSLRDI